MTTDEDTNYESGPFCPHWAEGECDEMCQCGHTCCEHEWAFDLECNVDGCKCEKFVDKEAAA